MRTLNSPVVRGTAAALCATLCATLLLATGADAQVPTLDRVDSLLATGQYDEARTTLERWWSAREEFDVPGSDLARALMLRGQLASDPDAAEPHYLSVVLGYPTSPHAPEALLRLGQGLLADGQAARAAAYLQRLAADYPGRTRRPVDLLWLARAQTAADRPGAACSAAREGLRDARDPDLTAMLRVEASASCSPAEQTGAETVAEAGPPPDRGPVRDPEPRPEPGPEPETRADVGDWSVQSGAFRYRRSADDLMDRLRDAGYEPRLVLVPRNDLMRVRVGRFPSSDDAARVVNRLRELGFEAIVVGDAARERRP